MIQNPANILIVDDIEDNRIVLSRLVKRLGHTFILAEDGLIAFEKLKEHQVDLVLLDIMMPNVDGYEVLSHIEDTVSLRHIPVIMITALDDVDSAVNCIKMGAQDYLTKPFKPILLRAKITSCLEKKFWHDKEEDYRRQIEEAKSQLEKQVQEKTRELAETNEKLEMLVKAKGEALKLIYYGFHNSIQDLFKKTVKNPLDEVNDLFKQSTKIDSNTVMRAFEIKSVQEILKNAINLNKEFADSRNVKIGPLPKNLDSEMLEPITIVGDDIELPIVPANLNVDDENTLKQKEFCTNALTDILKIAVKFSSGNFVEFSCEPLKDEIVVGIHATGRIIPEEELPDFFAIPTLEHKVIPGRYPGTAAANAKHIITLLGGSVNVENRDSDGISFTIKLKRDSFKNEDF
ncbi:response regulator [Candidatus Halobeggiatoa sp. HSG11]|nr:response regulator [Candidatus Halobeggiatoa sp. HSG11]